MKTDVPDSNPEASNIHIDQLSKRTFSTRHGGMCNILAADGHVANIKSNIILDWFDGGTGGAEVWTRGNSNNYAECPLL